MALYLEWDVKNVLTFFSLISDGLGGVSSDSPTLKLSLYFQDPSVPHALLYQFTTQQKSFLFSAVKPKSLRNKKQKPKLN